MSDIEKIIKTAAPSDAQLPEGHLERFEARLQALKGVQTDAAAETGAAGELSPRRRTGIIRICTFAAAVAAAFAAVIFIARPSPQPSDWFAGVADDPVEVCRTYSEKVTELSTAIYEKDLDGSLSETVRGLCDGAVPMIDQLPEELDACVRAEILKRYYGDLLDGLDKINKNI